MSARVPAFSPLSRIALSDQAYQVLKGAIFNRVFVPGAVLNTITVAERLGVSRTPVREAMRRLAQQGLLEIGARGQYTVHRMTLAERREVFLMRAALESLAVRMLLTEPRDPSLWITLEGLLRQQRGAALSQDSWRSLELDEAFHSAIAVASGLRGVAGFLSQLRDRILLLGGEAVLAPGRWSAVLEEHRAIIDTLRSGTAEDAVAAVALHLVHTAESLGMELAPLIAEIAGVKA